MTDIPEADFTGWRQTNMRRLSSGDYMRLMVRQSGGHDVRMLIGTVSADGERFVWSSDVVISHLDVQAAILDIAYAACQVQLHADAYRSNLEAQKAQLEDRWAQRASALAAD